MPLALTEPDPIRTSAEATSPTADLEFDGVYATHFDFVWRSLKRLGVPEHQLDDATQDVFLVVHRRLRDFEGRSTVKTWLFGIVLRVARTHRRTRLRRPTEPLLLSNEPAVEVERQPEALTEAARAAALVREILEALDDDRRVVFVLAELEQMTAPEIAGCLGVNLNTVYSRLRLARRDFQTALLHHPSRRLRCTSSTPKPAP
jgi:RNA polymerase sigma-70 factor (ECF subfamily)